MKQLSGLDAGFLYMETANQFGHVSSLSVYERPDDPDYDALESWRREVERRLPLLEPLRRRIRTVPLGLDHPFWEDDPNFDLEFHIRGTAVPPPGDDHQVANLVARIIARPLDRSRPLWESYVVEGLEGNRFGILTKFQHASIDGASGVELLSMMLDDSPEPKDLPEPEPWTAEAPKSDVEILARAGLGLARKPGRALLLSARTAQQFGKATRNPAMVAAAQQMRASLRGPLGSLLNAGRDRGQEATVAGPLPSAMGPPSPFNAPIGPHRRFAYTSRSLDDVKKVKKAVGATVNDVVMAMCAGGLRGWLERHDALPDKPLVAMIPVSIRSGDEEDKWTNRVSSIFAEIPTDEPDPLQRILRVHQSMVGAKEMHDAVPAEELTNFAQFPPPAVFGLAMRTATRLAGRLTMPVNVTISNVPGPRHPLYSAGATLLHYYPVSTIVDGQGLNITVQSYLDNLDFGLVSDRDLIPDLWDMLDLVVGELDVIADAAGVTLDG